MAVSLEVCSMEWLPVKPPTGALVKLRLNNSLKTLLDQWLEHYVQFF
jgi:hypothetical protein